MPQFTATRTSTLITFLREILPTWRRKTLENYIKSGSVLINNATNYSAGTLLEPNDIVEVLPQKRPVNHIPKEYSSSPFEVIYADKYLIAVNKPTGLLTVSTEYEHQNTLIALMRLWSKSQHPKIGDLHIVHRLDRETSGILLLARSLEVKDWFIKHWQLTEKTYIAVTSGIPKEREGTVTLKLKEDKGLFMRISTHAEALEAITHYQVLKSRNDKSLIEVKIDTGKKHQIRAHLSSLGSPIIGDLRYGDTKANRLYLHAQKLSFPHPATTERIQLEAKIPKSFFIIFNKKR